MSEDNPGICAQKLLTNEVDLALVPVAILPGLPEYHVLTDYCIGADGVVDSVKLYHNVPLQEIKRVLLDYQSRTSVNLTKVLFRFWWKSDPVFEDAEPGFEEKVSGTTAVVVIGDRTFALNGRYRYETDLAQAWKDFTGLPFVFAAWVSCGQLPAEFISRFNSVLADGVSQVDRAVTDSAGELSLPEEQVRVYLREKIDYHLDQAKRGAMNLFLEYLRKSGTRDR